MGSVGLSLGVQVLNLGLSKDAVSSLDVATECVPGGWCLHVGVGGGGLVDIGVVDNE